MAEYRISKEKVKDLLKDVGKDLLKDVGKPQKALAYDLWPGNTPKTAESYMTHCLNGKKRLSETQIKKAEAFLGKPRSDFGEQSKQANVSLTLSELYDLYDELPKGSTVSIVSADGFKETDDWDLQQKMVELVQRDVQVNYYYPAHGGQHGASAYRGLRDCLRSTLDKQHREPIEEPIEEPVREPVEEPIERPVPEPIEEPVREPGPLVQGFQVGQHGMRLFGWQTRYIIITRWNDQRDVQEVRDGFLYVVSAGTAEDHLPSDDTHECWLRMRLSVARDYYRTLCDHAQPIVDLGIYSNRLKSQIQDSYRTQLGQTEYLATYRELRDIIDTTGMILTTIQDTFIQIL